MDVYCSTFFETSRGWGFSKLSRLKLRHGCSSNLPGKFTPCSSNKLWAASCQQDCLSAYAGCWASIRSQHHAPLSGFDNVFLVLDSPLNYSQLRKNCLQAKVGKELPKQFPEPLLVGKLDVILNKYCKHSASQARNYLNYCQGGSYSVVDCLINCGNQKKSPVGNFGSADCMFVFMQARCLSHHLFPSPSCGSIICIPLCLSV